MNNKSSTIFIPFLLCLVFCISATNTLTQSAEHECEISITDFNTDTAKTLGEFTIAVENGNFITKFYKLPDTKLIITASVGYSAKLSSGDSKSVPPDEVFMVLILGKKRFKGSLSDLGYTKKVRKDVLSTASTILPFNYFREGKIMTTYLGKKQLVMIFLKCRKPN